MTARVGLCFLDRPNAAEQIRFAKLADRKGFDSIWICETRLVRDAISIMGALAVSTEQIKICSGVVNNWTRGAPLLVTPLHALRARGLHRSAVAVCLGGGEAVALAIEAA